MMGRLLVVMLFLLLSGCAGTFGNEMLGMMGASSFQNEPDGFRGVKWGQDVKTVSGLKLISGNRDGLEVYSRDGDPMSLGDAALTRIEYLFWQGQFMEVQLNAGAPHYQALVNVLSERFGEGYKVSPYSMNHSWSGPVTFVYLRSMGLTNEVRFKSREINDQMNIYLGQKAKAGAERGSRQDF